MSNPRKPAALKLISGTAQKCRDSSDVIELPLLKTAPNPPKWLKNEHALEAWNRLAPIYIANRLLSVASEDALAHMCALHGRVIQILEDGGTPPTSMTALLRNYHSDFGMTPVSISRVKPVGGKNKPNPFDDLDKPNRFANNGRHRNG